MNQSLERAPKQPDLNRAIDEDEEDESTVRAAGVRPLDMPNRETTDPGRHTATFALAEHGGQADTHVAETRIKAIDPAMEAQLLKESQDLMKVKIEAGRDPNELLLTSLEELQSVEDEIEDHTESNQPTMLKDAEMRKARLAAQVHWLQSYLDREN